tara:strand:+ start:354 stop:545 length:192 start_codon:yes stop_codon:yes gene_type:complete
VTNKSFSSTLTFFFFEAFRGNPSSFHLIASPIDYLEEKNNKNSSIRFMKKDLQREYFSVVGLI